MSFYSPITPGSFEDRCPVCLSDPGEMNDPVATKCHHIFCKTCLEEVERLMGVCSICKQPLSDRASDIKSAIKDRESQEATIELLAADTYNVVRPLFRRLQDGSMNERTFTNALAAQIQLYSPDLRPAITDAVLQRVRDQSPLESPERSERLRETLQHMDYRPIGRVRQSHATREHEYARMVGGLALFAPLICLFKIHNSTNEEPAH